MRNRYVIQVLLATFGFAILLAVIAVLQTPANLSLQGTGSPGGSDESLQCHTKPPAQTPQTTPPADDFKDECEFPAQCD